MAQVHTLLLTGTGTHPLSHPPLMPPQVQATHHAARELLLLSRVINQTVGDAISGVLLVEAVLRSVGFGWSLWPC